MKFALLTLLLSLAAPAPFVEMVGGLEEETVVESARSAAPRAIRRRPLRAPAAEAAPAEVPVQEFDPRLPIRETSAWTPRLHSRPPPLG